MTNCLIGAGTRVTKCLIGAGTRVTSVLSVQVGSPPCVLLSRSLAK